MAPVAGMLKERGFHVTGSDVNVYPPASTLLDSLGIRWNEGFGEENLKPAPDLCVVGNVIARGNPEIEYILDEKMPYCSMPQLLEEYFIPRHTSIVIAGTHGKTTTTAMLAWIFHVAGRQPDFLIGGVAPNFGDRSYGLGGGEEFIIEGDEYETAFFDRGPKFLHYHPDELILTSLEYDHADIYPDLASIALQFRRLVNLVPRRGKILIWGESAELRETVAKAFCPVETFGLTPECDWCAGDMQWHDEATEFRVAFRGREVTRVRSPVAGKHNVLDALAAIAIAYGRGIEGEAIERALATFVSVRKRMEIKGEDSGVSGSGRFRASSHRDSHDAGSHAHTLARPQNLGGDRAPLKHDAAQNFSRRPAGSAGHRGRRRDWPREPRATVGGTANGFRLNRSRTRSEARTPCQGVRFSRGDRGLSRDSRNAGDMVMVMSNGSFDGLSGKLLEKLKSLEGVRK